MSVYVGCNSSWLKLLVIEGQGLTIACTIATLVMSVYVGCNSSWLKLLVIDGQGLTIACTIATLFLTTTTSRMVLRPTHPLAWVA